jgi:rod shape-determining protein MreC
MKKFINSKGIIIAIVAVLIAAIGVVAVNSASSSGAVTGAVNTVFRPLKTLVSKVTGAYESLYGYIYEYDKLVAENAELEKRNADLEEGYLDYEQLYEENQRLRNLLDFSTRNEDYEFNEASIISWSASNWSSTFTINIGSSNSDIALGDSVTTEYGALVGIVTDVGALTSTVKAITDTTFSASVNVGADSTVTASGDFSLMGDGKMKLGYFDSSAGIASGDTVVTSGKGGVFPQGLLLGYVESIYSESGELNMYGVLTPAADLSDLLYVYVITDFNHAT